MTNRLLPQIILILSILASTDEATAGESPDIKVAASTPLVNMQPRPGGRFIRLPSLDFEFLFRPDCPRDLYPESLTLSVADTRKSIAATEVAAANVVPVTLQVPAMQLAPIAAENFCRTGNDGITSSIATELTFPDVLTAQVSLRCASDSAEAITYVSHALDVTIRCELAEPEAEDPQAGKDTHPAGKDGN